MQAAPVPLVTVAVLAYNRRDPLATTLTKLTRELDHPADRLEIIVVDNASEDGTEAMVRERFPEVRVIRREENIGVPAWNDAFAAGSGDWFLALDDDCYIEGDALTRALAAAARHAADLVSFRVASSDPDHAFSDDYQTGVLTFWGCAALISRQAIDRLGGFDPRIFLWAHELEFTMRLLDAGMVHLVLPEVTAVHMKPIPGAAMAMNSRNLKHFGYIAAKALQPGDAAVVIAKLVVRALVQSVHPELRGGASAVLEGARMGLRARQPVRPAVSRVYRRDFVEFTTHLRFVRTPLQRLRDRRSPVPPYARRGLFWEARRLMYPLDRPVAYRVP